MSKGTWRPPADARPGDTFRAGRRLWSAADDAILRAQYPDNPTAPIAAKLRRSMCATYNRALVLGLAKSALYLASPAAARLRRGGLTASSIAHRFQKGMVPHNKGLRGRKGYAPGRMADTQFRKGQLPHNCDPDFYVLGALRVNTDGYVDMRVSFDQGGQGWRPLHRILWEDAHGPVPRGHVVVFKDGEKLNVELGNLKLITLRENMLRNSVHNLPKPVARAVQLLGALNRQIRRREKHA